jgi:hypothetical protein
MIMRGTYCKPFSNLAAFLGLIFGDNESSAFVEHG